MIPFLSLAAGSLAGGFARYYLAGFITRVFGSSFPYGTLVVNLSGCFLIGVFAAVSEKKFDLGPHGRLLLMVGFCGAFTTFSALILETSSLIREGETIKAFLNALLSFVAGFMLFRAGFLLGELV